MVLPLAQADQASPGERVATGYAGERKKVLVVDDVIENRMVLVDMLQPLGFVTYEAGDGHAGLAQAQAVKPDMILMDNVMPVMNGLETTRRLRALPDFKNVPIIAISASASQSDVDEAARAGATDFLPKPFRATQLIALLERHLGLRFDRR